jgi:Ni,Fe-hydrogenase III component G
MHQQGQRFITMSCAEVDDGFLMYYHFDNNELKMTHLHFKLSKGEELASISQIYWCALLIENEISEQFGIKINDMAIDFGGTLVLGPESPKTPLLKKKV